MEAFRRASRNGLLALSLALLGAGPALAQDFVSIGTASPAGAYYPLGVAMADLWNRNVPGVRLSAQETGRGVADMNMIASGETGIGNANENIAGDAQKAYALLIRPFDFSGGWMVHASSALVVAAASAGIVSVPDLAGKRVSLGAPVSSGNVIGQRLLESQ